RGASRAAGNGQSGPDSGNEGGDRRGESQAKADHRERQWAARHPGPGQSRSCCGFEHSRSGSRAADEIGPPRSQRHCPKSEGESCTTQQMNFTTESRRHGEDKTELGSQESRSGKPEIGRLLQSWFPGFLINSFAAPCLCVAVVN